MADWISGIVNAAQGVLDTASDVIEQKYNDDLEATEKQIEAAQAKYKENNDKIRDAINKTNVNEASIPYVLHLLNDSLLGHALNSTVRREELNANISAFGEFITTLTNTSISIEAMFTGHLEPFIAYLNAKGYVQMNDLLCDNAEEFAKIVQIIESGIEAENKETEEYNATIDANNAEIEKREVIKPINTGPVLKKLKRMCMREEAVNDDDGWMKKQEQKRKIVKAQLSEISAPLAIFFGEIGIAYGHVLKVLEYNVDYNSEQKLAIENAEKNEKELKAITDTEKSEEKESKSDDVEKGGSNEIGNDTLATNADGLHLDQERTNALEIAQKENNALLTAALLKLHVAHSLESQFEGGKFPETGKIGFDLAKEVENCSMDIMRSQAAMRSSLLVVKQLVEFKPPNPGPQAVPFWKVIDNGIITISGAFTAMADIANNYCAFFGKSFKSSFEYYVSCHEKEGDELDLDAATKPLQSDIDEFTKFKSTMQATVDKLTANAKAVISGCVAQTAGVTNFNEALAAREKAEKELIEQRNELNKLRLSRTNTIRSIGIAKSIAAAISLVVNVATTAAQ